MTGPVSAAPRHPGPHILPARRRCVPAARDRRERRDCHRLPHLPDTTPEDIRGAARIRAEQAAETSADLPAIEARGAARAVSPTMPRLVFRLSNDVSGATATLVAADTADGEHLWHADTGDEWPDESYANPTVMPHKRPGLPAAARMAATEADIITTALPRRPKSARSRLRAKTT